MAQEAKEAAEPKIRRDVRVDAIGFVVELQKRFIDEKLKPAVKGSMSVGETIRGDYYEAQLYPGGVSADKLSADPVKVLGLFERGLITRKELAGMMSVDLEKVKQVTSLTIRQINALTVTTPGGKPLTDKFVVGRIAGIDVAIETAAAGLDQALNKRQSVKAAA